MVDIFDFSELVVGVDSGLDWYGKPLMHKMFSLNLSLQ